MAALGVPERIVIVRIVEKLTPALVRVPGFFLSYENDLYKSGGNGRYSGLRSRSLMHESSNLSFGTKNQMKKIIAVFIASLFVFSTLAEARGFAARGFSARSFSRPARVVTPKPAPTKNTVVVNKKTTVNNTQQESSSGAVSNFVSDVALTAAGVAIGNAVYNSVSSDKNEDEKKAE